MYLFQMPPEFISTGKNLLVRFKTDDTITWKGFSASFVLASPDAEPITHGTNYGNQVTQPPRPHVPHPKAKGNKKAVINKEDHNRENVNDRDT